MKPFLFEPTFQLSPGQSKKKESSDRPLTREGRREGDVQMCMGVKVCECVRKVCMYVREKERVCVGGVCVGGGGRMYVHVSMRGCV